MSRCTAAEAVKAMEYWIGYHEKKDGTRKYLTKDKNVFDANAGSGNYTYMGELCGVPNGAWCAMTISEAVYTACGDSRTDAKAVLWGIWPYSVCDQVWEAAPARAKHTRASGYEPKPGDIIVFSSAKYTYAHTGMVYKYAGGIVYTIEGNVDNMCKRMSYSRTNTRILGYITPNYADGGETENENKEEDTVTVTLNMLQKGSAGDQVRTVQRICQSKGYKGSDGKALAVDGEFGVNTDYAVRTAQRALGLQQDGIVGPLTWNGLLKQLG